MPCWRPIRPRRYCAPISDSVSPPELETTVPLRRPLITRPKQSRRSLSTRIRNKRRPQALRRAIVTLPQLARKTVPSQRLPICADNLRPAEAGTRTAVATRPSARTGSLAPLRVPAVAVDVVVQLDGSAVDGSVAIALTTQGVPCVHVLADGGHLRTC